MQRLYNLFSYYNDYIYLANEEWTPQLSNGSLESLESLHDTIHLLAGGQNTRMGHMSYPPYAAFDPIFWLHHCMVDRIFALWQTLHPETWITPHRALQSTHTTSRGEIQDSQTALTPFYSSDNGTFWTSDGVRDHTRFGYTYPELLSESASRTEERQAAVRRAVNRLYGRQSPAVLFLSSTNLASQRARSGRLGGDATSLEMASLSRTANERIFHGSNRYHEWTANIRVEKQACDGPFSILIFLGCPPDDPLDWMSSPSHIGTMGVWTAGKQDHGENGQMAMDGLYVSGTVPLTAALVQKIAAGELASLEPNEVEFYLKMKLEKRVLGPGGRVWDADKVKGLKIQIVSSLVKAPSREEELPVRASTIVHFDL
jgi:tyrosinase